MNAATALRTHRLLLRIALSAANAFVWIFAFEFFYIVEGDVAAALARVVLLYALSQIVTALLTPFAARGLRHSMRREIVWGVVVAAAAFIFLGAAFEGFFGAVSIIALIGFALLLGIYRALYWVPYEVERHEFATIPARMSSEVLIALMPVFAGFMMGLLGIREAWLLFAAGALMIVSMLPLVRIPDTYERFSWGYRETFGQLFARAHRRQFFRAIIDGVQGAAMLLIWPVAIFLVVGWSYPAFGLIFSFSLLLLIVARDAVASVIRRMQLHASLPVRIAVVSSAWVGRVLAVNPISIVVIDAYAHTGNPKVSVDHATFEQVSDAGHFIDEYTALREIGLSIGRIFLCCVVAIAVGIVPLAIVFGIAFVIAALSAGASVLLSSAGKPSI